MEGLQGFLITYCGGGLDNRRGMISSLVQVNGDICKQVWQDGTSYECRVMLDEVHSRGPRRLRDEDG